MTEIFYRIDLEENKRKKNSKKVKWEKEEETKLHQKIFLGVRLRKVTHPS